MRIPRPLTKLKTLWLWRHRGKVAAFGPFVAALVIYLGYLIYNYSAKASYEKVMTTWYQYDDTADTLTTDLPVEPIEGNFFTDPALLAEKNNSYPEKLTTPTKEGYSGFVKNAGIFNNGNKGFHLMGVPSDLSLWFDPTVKGNQRELALHGIKLLETFQARELALRQAAALPHQQLPKAKDINGHTRIISEYSSVCRNIASYYSCKAILNIHSGQASEALLNTITQIQIAKHFQDPELLLDFLYYNAFLNVISHSVWEGLNAKIWDDAQLLSLEKHLEEIDLRRQFIHAMRGEFAYAASEVQMLIDNPKHLDEQRAKFSLLLGATGTPSLKERAIEYARKSIPHGWYVYQYAGLLKAYDEILLHPQGTANHQLDISHYHAFQNRKNPLKTEWFNDFITHLPNMGMHARQVAKALQGQAKIHNMRVAIALERYHLAQGNYPSTLAPLAPDFLASVPTDVVNGEPLQYRVKQDGTPLIYSIGVNGSDDGGRPNRDTQEADWAWMYSPPKGFTYQDYRTNLSN
ncbi:hypothetical protein NT6N_31060 [Oceaniferula spumae]|uniref:Type II secretion system protein GspG C-terminal domain-containing protein n=1 Tax=Oceaniferula spumae TaxID=2979115 RepID=A0AAT9FPW4_9BACT